MTNKLEIKIICHNCGVKFYAVAGTPNILDCPVCYNK
jgi:rubrerythrin